MTQIDDRKLYTGSSCFFAQHQGKRKKQKIVIEVVVVIVVVVVAWKRLNLKPETSRIF